MAATKKIKNSRVPDRSSKKKPPAKAFYEYAPQLDGPRQSLTRGLTYKKLRGFFDAARNGELAESMRLFEEVEAADLKLRSVAATRRLALTGLPWEVTSAAEKNPDRTDKALADDAAFFVREQLDNAENFNAALEHLGQAIGQNLAVLELAWDRNHLVDFIPIYSPRLTMRPELSMDVRVLAVEFPMGIVAEQPQFVVHIPQAKSGSPISDSLSQAAATFALMKWLAIANWATFCEIFGMPIRIGKYTPSTTEDEKAMLREMLSGIGAAAWAMVSQSTEIELTESSQRGSAPYDALVNWIAKEQSIAWLGANLTSDTTGSTGTYAAAAVHDKVRGDLLDDDIRREARTVRCQIIGPMCAMEFQRDDVPLPHFTRRKPETIDRIKEAQLFRAAQVAGLKVEEDYGYNRLGIPKPKEGARLLQPMDAFGEGIREGGTPTIDQAASDL